MERLILLFPTLIIIESLIASIFYVCTKKYGSALYWFSAALLNVSAVWLIKKVG